MLLRNLLMVMKIHQIKVVGLRKFASNKIKMVELQSI
jgi:hypothetical protein